jgi:hypothetical protein
MKTIRMFLFILTGLMLVYLAWHNTSGQTAVIPVELWRSGTVIDAEGHLLTVIFPGNAPGPINRVGIGTTKPAAKLHVVGTTRTSVLEFPDGTFQNTAQLMGPPGPQGPPGPKGDPGPAVNTVAVCQSGAPVTCACEGETVTRVFGTCSVTSDTGPCNNTGPGCCAVCTPG